MTDVPRNLTINYQFTDGFSMSVMIPPQPGMYHSASNAGPFAGYAVAGGTFTYTVAGTPYTKQIPPQSVQPTQILWAYPNGGDGGSKNGIDNYGFQLTGIIKLDWCSQSGFSLDLGQGPKAVTLTSCEPWPPKA